MVVTAPAHSPVRNSRSIQVLKYPAPVYVSRRIMITLRSTVGAAWRRMAPHGAAQARWYSYFVVLFCEHVKNTYQRTIGRSNLFKLIVTANRLPMDSSSPLVVKSFFVFWLLVQAKGN